MVENDTVLLGYIFQGYVRLETDHVSLSDKQLLLRICNIIKGCDGFKYYQRFLTDPEKKYKTSFLLVCSQDEGVQRQLDDTRRQRFHTRMETRRCGGQVSGYIVRVNDIISLGIEHSVGHPALCKVDNNVPDAVRNFIVDGALNFSAHDLYERAIEDYSNETEKKMLFNPDMV
ncbi:hypothetical protein DFQ30_006359 [Apophysomyces sp. BC1015]|nr:hypothetical protein DFQ30_006359 [Apophysomyces sp. BC1015]